MNHIMHHHCTHVYNVYITYRDSFVKVARKLREGAGESESSFWPGWPASLANNMYPTSKNL